MTTPNATVRPGDPAEIQTEQQNFRQPFVIDPGLAEAGKK